MGKTLFLFLLLAVSVCGNLAGQHEMTASGRITDESGSPVSGAVISVEGSSLTAVTDESGFYRLVFKSPGKIRFRVSHIGYETVVRDVDLAEPLILDIIIKTTDYVTGEVLVSATRAGEKSPMAYSSVSRELIGKNNMGQDLPYMLALTPSLVETSEAGNGIGYTSLRIRGTDGSRINVTIDGIPLNDPESQQVFWVDLPDIAASTDNIQVQRGAGTSSNGAGAFGASVSLQTKSPENSPFAELNSSAGSFGTFKTSIAAGTGLLSDRFSLQMRYSDLKSKGYIDRTGSDHRSAYISGLYRNPKSSLRANLIIGEEHTGIGWWGVPADSLATNRRYNPAGQYRDNSGAYKYYDNESDNYKQNHFQVLWNRKTGEHAFLNAALHYTKGRGYYEEYSDYQQYSYYGLSDVITGSETITSTDLIRQKWMDNDFLGIVYSLKYNKGALDAVLGGGANTYNGDHFGKLIWMEYAGTTPKDYEWYRNNGRKDEFSFYAKAGWNISRAVSVFGDLQYRHIGYWMSGTDDDLRDISQEHSFGFFNPKAGVFVTPGTNQKAWLSFSVANREPTRADFKEASGDPGATPRPETMYDTEAGYSVSGAKGSFSVNTYFMYYKDQLVPTGELSNVGYVITTNVPESYRLGVEFIAGFTISDWLKWDLNATISRNRIYDFVDHYIDYDTFDYTSTYTSRNLGDVDIAYSPSLTGSSDINFTLPKNLGLHLISKYVGRQYFDNTMSSSRMIDPFLVSSLRIDYSPDLGFLRGADMQLLVNNLFNAQYESNAYGGKWSEGGTEKTWAYYFPQAGINFMARIGIRF